MPDLKPYVVEQGDYLTQLAYRMGFDADAVWNHPKNAELSESRPNREVLAPGDVIFVPDEKPKGTKMSAGDSKSFVTEVKLVPVNLVLRDALGEPLVAELVSVPELDDDQPKTTGDHGSVTFHVPIAMRSFRLELPRRRYGFDVRVGEMDPVDEGDGALKRLSQLGYGGGPLVGIAIAAGVLDEPDDDAVAAMLRAFQSDLALPETGDLDDKTSDALVQAHGS